jgi:hypothetical protein
MAHNYEVGTRAWQPDPTEGWIASEVKEKVVDGDKVQLVFLLENGEVFRGLCTLICVTFYINVANNSIPGEDENARD